MVGVVDTSILVDVIRNHTPALDWLDTQSQLGITTLVYMELVEGATTRADRQRALRLLSRFSLVYLTEADQQWAMQQHLVYAPSASVGLVDCLIASVGFRLQLPLYTRNLKHFRPLLGPLAVNPYP